MASVASTSTPTEVLAPPTERYSVLGWLQKNLFSNWFNSVLTIVVLVILYLILRPLLTWLFFGAEWGVIRANFNLIMRGRYPASEAWRLWSVLYILGGVIGFCIGVWSRRIQPATALILIIPLLLMLVPFFPSTTRLNWMVVEIAGLVALGIGFFWPKSWSGVATYLIMAAALVTLVLLYGYGGDDSALPLVPTELWGGLLLSLLLAFFGIAFSFPLGVLLALGRQSKLHAIRLLCVIYIEFIRGVPLITLLFMSVVMLQLFLPSNFPRIDTVLRCLVAITLFSAAYTAENVRGGLQAIPKGQAEAAHALGMNGFQTMTRIVLPQALRTVIPVLVGQFIGLFKDTSLVALVGLFDLLGMARSVLANPNWLGTHQEVYVFVALVYWIFCYAMAYGSRKLEDSLGVGQR